MNNIHLFLTLILANDVDQSSNEISLKTFLLTYDMIKTSLIYSQEFKMKYYQIPFVLSFSRFNQ